MRAGQERNWHETSQAGEVASTWRNLSQSEANATFIRNYEAMVVPGLAQIPAYTRAVVQGSGRPLTEAQVERFVAARQSRQLILRQRTTPTVQLLMDEMVLHRPVGGPEVLRAQLRHLLNGPFLLLHLQDGSRLVYSEGQAGSSFLEEEEHFKFVNETWRLLFAAALSPGDSAWMLTQTLGSATTAKDAQLTSPPQA